MFVAAVTTGAMLMSGVYTSNPFDEKKDFVSFCLRSDFVVVADVESSATRATILRMKVRDVLAGQAPDSSFTLHFASDDFPVAPGTAVLAWGAHSLGAPGALVGGFRRIEADGALLDSRNSQPPRLTLTIGGRSIHLPGSLGALRDSLRARAGEGLAGWLQNAKAIGVMRIEGILSTSRGLEGRTHRLTVEQVAWIGERRGRFPGIFVLHQGSDCSYWPAVGDTFVAPLSEVSPEDSTIADLCLYRGVVRAGILPCFGIPLTSVVSALDDDGVRLRIPAVRPWRPH